MPRRTIILAAVFLNCERQHLWGLQQKTPDAPGHEWLERAVF